MEINWMKYFLQAGQELRIIAEYSIIIAVFTLSLKFIQWDHDILISFINLLVLFAIAHTEDRDTVNLSWTELITRFATSSVAYFTSRKIAIALKTNYLSGNLSTYDTDSKRPSLILLTMLVECMDTWRFVSSARIYIIAVILIIFAAPVVTSTIAQASFNAFTSLIPDRFVERDDDGDN